MRSGSVVLECGPSRLVWEQNPAGNGLGYSLEVSHPEGWRCISAPANPLVRGASFDLFPASARQLDDGTILFAPSQESTLPYQWLASARANPNSGWITVEVRLDVPRPFALRMEGGYEPEVTVDMGLLPPYERGDHVWFKTEVSNPTKWNDEAHGNDMPALYYHDPYRLYEVMMFFDMTAMDWMGFGNIARFLNYRFGFRRRYRPQPAFELGMWADGYSGREFPAGRTSLRWHLRAAHLTGPVSEHDAIKRLVTCCLGMIPEIPAWRDPSRTWTDLSSGCARDLADKEHCWGRDEKGEFPLNYVDGWAPAWAESMAAKGKPAEFGKSPCYDSAMWMVQPLWALNRLGTGAEFTGLYDRILAFCRQYLWERNGFVATRPDARPDANTGVWQYVYGLESTLQIGLHEKDRRIVDLVVTEVREVLVPFARSVGRLFPLIFSRHRGRKVGPGDSHGVSGIYALLMLEIHRVTGESVFLDEAAEALRILGNLPVNAVLQEAFLTAMGAQAACRVAELTGKPEFLDTAAYLHAQTLRQMYWFTDRTTPATRDFDTLASFHACTPILYPALFENVEVLARLAACMRQLGVSPALLRVFDHGRRNYQCFYPACLPAQYRRSAVPFVPLENIAILEGPEPAYVGQEIYGAGWTFRAHLLWEAFGRCEDREVMVLNLATYGERDLLGSADAVVPLAVFNPGPDPRRAVVELPFATGDTCMVSPPDSPRVQHPLAVEAGRAALRLGSGEFRVLEVPIRVPHPAKENR